MKLGRKKNKTVENIVLCDGIEIDKSFYYIKENRLKTLFLKGIIVYLLTMGSIGCYLSAVDIDFSAPILNMVIFISAIGCAFLYYNRIVENVGYILLFIVFFSTVYIFMDYINSGFYAVVNDTIEQASTYLDLEGVRTYNERISDRYLAVTVSMCFVGIVSNILLNVYISRRMQYMVAIPIVITLNLIPIYFELEPDTIYTVMLLGGLSLTYVLKASQHYRVRSNDNMYLMDKKKNVKYAYNLKSLAEMCLVAFIAVFVVVEAVAMAFPKNSFNTGYIRNQYKERTMETVSDVISLGLAGLFDYYPNTGGLMSGRLGNVNRVRLDYNTDLTVTLTPYSYDTLYLKYFTGGEYLPYQNMWQYDEQEDYDAVNKEETEALREAYEEGREYSARGTVIVDNVEAATGNYFPYYSSDTDNLSVMGREAEYEFYPEFYGTDIKIESNEDLSYYLEVPEVNREVIAEFCEEAGFSGSDSEIIQQVVNYYQENIPYTIRPGATPRGNDFINYFLSEGRKGYCAHFASAATLIFRYYGIPARYIEGYAISYDQMLVSGELDEERSYDDFYDGYSELGETAVISVDATDADAHAWVEVYDEDMGWVVVDVTPSSGEEESGDFWDAFQNILDDGNQSDDTETVVERTSFRIDDNILTFIAILLLGLVIIALIVLALIYLIRRITYVIRYYKSGLNDRLIMRYSAYLKRMTKKCPGLKTSVNYRQQINYLYENEVLSGDDESKDRIIDILERAGFSNKMINEEEFKYVEDILK